MELYSGVNAKTPRDQYLRVTSTRTPARHVQICHPRSALLPANTDIERATVDGDGCMDEPERVRLPEGFEDVDVDILVQLVGARAFYSISRILVDVSCLFDAPDPHPPPPPTADMLVRLTTHNDRIPLSPCASSR